MEGGGNTEAAEETGSNPSKTCCQKWSSSGYILNIEPTGLATAKSEEKGGSNSDMKLLGSSSQKVELSLLR